jgi:hypothetical protein
MDSTVPVMSDDTLLETTIAEPSMRAGEVEMLLFALERPRCLDRPSKRGVGSGEATDGLVGEDPPQS